MKFLLKNLHKNQAYVQLKRKTHGDLIHIKHLSETNLSLTELTLESQDKPISNLILLKRPIINDMLFDYKRLTEELEYNGVILAC